MMKRRAGRDPARVPGAGAAGGLGFGLFAFLQARPASGFELFAERAGLSRRLENVDLVVTGEGTIDDSTLMGKGVGELAQLARRRGVPYIALGGNVTRTADARRGFTESHGLTDLTSPVQAKAKPAP